MKPGWGPWGPEHPGTAWPCLPVKHALGLDTAFVPWMEILACCLASPGARLLSPRSRRTATQSCVPDAARCFMPAGEPELFPALKLWVFTLLLFAVSMF